MVKEAIESLWKDRCAVVEYQPYTKPNGATGHREEIVAEGLPCKLSFSEALLVGQPPAEAGEVAAPAKQIAKLFISPAQEIKPGSKLRVQHKGREFIFAASGRPAIFTYHQEIMLKEFVQWA